MTPKPALHLPLRGSKKIGRIRDIRAGCRLRHRRAATVVAQFVYALVVANKSGISGDRFCVLLRHLRFSATAHGLADRR